MKKIEIVKEYLLKRDNLKDMVREIELLLDNNYGSNIQYIYSLVNTDKEELGEYFKNITKEECLKLKWQIIEATLDTVQRFIIWESDIEISQSTIKKAMKEINFYNDFNLMILDGLNGDIDNINTFKRWFISK